ncbi:unnamed protein product [Bathycoccus prasinos]
MAKPSTTAASAKAFAVLADEEAPAPPAYESLNDKTTNNDDDISNNASSDSPLNETTPNASTEENESSTSWFEKLTTRELLAISPNSDQLLPSNENGEKEEEETLKCEVVDPKKIGQGLTAYAAYTIKSESTCRSYKKASAQVERRYSDFEWLRNKLLQNYPGIVLYKLPEKISVADPFDEEFLEKRRVGFEQFMKAACENEELKLSKVLMQFLCDDQLEKEPWYAKVNATSALDGIGSMFSGLGNEDESVPSNSSNNNTPNKMNSANTNTNNTNNNINNINSESPGGEQPTSSGNKEDPDFAALSSYIKKLEKELRVSVDVAEQVILSFYSLAMLSEAMGENASFLGDCETKGAQMLLKSNQAGGLGKAFKKTGEAMKAMKDPMERRSRDLSKQFRQPLVWAKHLSESCKESTEARAKCLYDVVQAKKRLEQASEKLENQLGGGSIVVNAPPPPLNSSSTPDATPTKATGATESPTSTAGTPNNATEQLTSWFSSVTSSLTAKPPTIYEMQQDVELKTREARAMEAKYELVKRRTMIELPNAHERIEKVLNSCFEDMTQLMQELAKVQVAEFESIMPGSTNAQH